MKLRMRHPAVVVRPGGHQVAVEQREGGDAQGDGASHELEAHAAEVHHHPEEEDHHQHAAHLALGQREGPGDAHQHGDLGRAAQVAHGVGFGFKVFGDHDDAGQLHKFGGLDRVTPQHVDPCLHARGLTAQSDQQQPARHVIEQRASPADELVGEIGNHAHHHRGNQEKDGLTHPVVGGDDVVEQRALHLGGRAERGHGHGQHPEAGQSVDHQGQRQVKMRPRPARFIEHHPVSSPRYRPGSRNRSGLQG